MSPTKAGVLLGLFVLLLAVYFGLQWRGRQLEEQAEAERRLFDVAVESVTGVRLDRPGEPTIRVTRPAGGEWRIVEPRELRADQFAVQRLVRGVAEAERERALEGADPDAPEYGLAPPTVTVTLETDSGPHRLAVGARAPVGGAAYVRSGDASAVLLVPASVRADATQTLFDLRDKRIVDVAEGEVRRLEVRRGAANGSSIVLVKEGEEWRLEGAPEGRKLDEFKVNRFVDAAIGMRMTEVLGDDPGLRKERGLAPPARTVSIELASGDGPTIEIGAPDDSKGTAAAVAGEPEVYLVDSGSIEPLGWEAEELLEPPPTPTPSPSPSPSASPSP